MSNDDNKGSDDDYDDIGRMERKVIIIMGVVGDGSMTTSPTTKMTPNEEEGMTM